MKQMESRSVTIGDNVFYIRPLPAFKAANMSGELAALAMPILAGLTPLLGSDGNANIMEVDLEKAAPAIGDAFSTISGDKLEGLLKQLLIAGRNISVETPDSDKAQLLTEDLANEIFCEEVQEMFLLAFEVIRTNYKGFFKKLGTQYGTVIGSLTQGTPT